MQKYKLIACDLDGTLLNSKRELSEENVSAVRSAVKRGAIFVIATGRPYEGVKTIARKLENENGSFILFNGALVMTEGKTVFSSCIEKTAAEYIVSEGQKRNTTVVMWKKDGLYAEKECAKVDFYKSISGVEPKYVSDLKTVCNDDVIKILWYNDAETTPLYLEEMKNSLKKRAAVYMSRADFLEFVDAKCSKKTALRKIAEYYGVPVRKIIAIGDGDNDIPMLTEAGLSVAMGNADEAVKKICALITSDCDNNGVKEVICKLISSGRL